MRQFIAIVTKNADFTEGRGPMLFDKAFESKAAAEAYVSKQPGVYATPQGYDARIDAWNGYAIKVVTVFGFEDWEAMHREEVRTKAINKLTSEERTILGL